MKRKRKKEKTLLLHYDKHENNFPPIFSIKIIAFFISFRLVFAHSREQKKKPGKFAIDAVVVSRFSLLLACSKLKSLSRRASSGRDGNENICENPLEYPLFNRISNSRDASSLTVYTDPSNFLCNLRGETLHRTKYWTGGRKFHRHGKIHYRFFLSLTPAILSSHDELARKISPCHCYILFFLLFVLSPSK